MFAMQGAPPIPVDVVLGADADEFRQRCFRIKPDERPSATELLLHPYLTVPTDWRFTGFN